MEYIVPRLRIVVITEITNVGAIKECLSQLLLMEEDQFNAGYNQRVEKDQ